MPLLRTSDLRRAANRANARKSTGPRTPAGRLAAAENGRQRRLHSHTYEIPASWRAPLLQRAIEQSAHVHDPIERKLHQQMWLAQGEFDLFFIAYDAILAEFQQSHHCSRRTAQGLILTHPGILCGLSRIYSRARRQVDLAIANLAVYRHAMANPAIPTLAQPTAFAATSAPAAGSLPSIIHSLIRAVGETVESGRQLDCADS